MEGTPSQVNHSFNKDHFKKIKNETLLYFCRDFVLGRRCLWRHLPCPIGKSG